MTLSFKETVKTEGQIVDPRNRGLSWKSVSLVAYTPFEKV
jgi:hypothetical protein